MTCPRCNNTGRVVKCSNAIAVFQPCYNCNAHMINKKKAESELREMLLQVRKGRAS